MQDRWDSELFSDKNFGDLFSKSRQIASSRFNRNSAILSFNFVSIVFLLVAFFYPNALSATDVGKASSQLIIMSFGYITSILGFLVTGFSIFATIISPETLKLLSISRYRNNKKFTNIQFIMYNFMYVFFYYISALLYFLFLILFASENSPFAARELFNFVDDERFFVFVNGAIFCSSVALIVYLILLLKSFIWNIYQSVLLIAAARALYMDHAANQK